MVVEFRSALRSDARDIARLFRISSEGAADYIWSQLAQPGQDLLDVGPVGRIVDTCQITPHPIIRVTGEAYLMYRP